MSHPRPAAASKVGTGLALSRSRRCRGCCGSSLLPELSWPSRERSKCAGEKRSTSSVSVCSTALRCCSTSCSNSRELFAPSSCAICPSLSFAADLSQPDFTLDLASERLATILPERWLLLKYAKVPLFLTDQSITKHC